MKTILLIVASVVFAAPVFAGDADLLAQGNFQNPFPPPFPDPIDDDPSDPDLDTGCWSGDAQGNNYFVTDKTMDLACKAALQYCQQQSSVPKTCKVME